ncbi:MAG TPA: propanediol utilization protein, partial [Leuconostoc mesenteroides]|nr:propanediol utilization protein [Leuconostoc mesenteroides]
NGQEGKFSIEYIAWQILTFGDVNDKLFDSSVSTEKFQEMSYLFKRVNDLKNIAVDQREILVEFVRTDKSINTIYIDWPQGSPQNPLTMDEIYVKLAHALSIDENELFDILTAGLTSKSVAGLLNIIARI